MANLDRYLEFLKLPGAESIYMRSDQPIEVQGGGPPRPASKGPATAAQILALLAEVLPPDFRQKCEGTPVEFPWQAPTGPMTIRVQLMGGSVIAQLRTGSPRAAGAQAASGGPATGGNPAMSAAMNAAAGSSASAPVAAAPPKPALVTETPKHIDELFAQMMEAGASDLHLKSGQYPHLRVNGDMRAIEGRPILEAADLWSIVNHIMPERNRTQFAEAFDTDFAYQLPTGTRMRCNVFKDIVGPGAVFRQIPSKILTTKDLGIAPAVVKLCDYPKGLILVTGPTGSGKSTTLAALIDHLNDSEALHIITIEDPVEFVHKDKKSLVNQRELASCTLSFKAALRAALREDPDVVLVGELRDLETTEIAIETAETGHLVFATLHTNTAASTVDRMINQFPADRQEQIRLMLSTSLIGVVSQTLCRKKGGGRVAALEVLIGTPAISNLVREGKTFQIPSIMQTSRGIGMQTLNDALLELATKKQIEPEEAFACSLEKKEMAQALTRGGFRGAWTELGQPSPGS